VLVYTYYPPILSWVYLITIGVPTQLFSKNYLITLPKAIIVVVAAAALLHRMNDN
jgi:hypothetical protein